VVFLFCVGYSSGALAAQGVAAYYGLPGEQGTLEWSPDTTTNSDYLILKKNGDGSYEIGSYQNTIIGYATTDGQTPLRIPDPTDDLKTEYDIYASWHIPSNPKELVDPEDSTNLRAAYFYVGIDSGGSIDSGKHRYGIEWKNIGNGEEWVVRGQNLGEDRSAIAVNNGVVPTHINIHIKKVNNYDYYDIDLDPSTPDELGAVMFASYQLDQGPWQAYVAFGDEAIPFSTSHLGEVGDDLITFKVRGMGTHHFYGLRIVGEGVPNVNTGLDYDKDGDPNETDPLPMNPSFDSLSTTSTNVVTLVTDFPDNDGNYLIDSWEMDTFGATGQATFGDSDNDGTSNWSEMMMGTSPIFGGGCYAEGTAKGTTGLNDLTVLAALVCVLLLLPRWKRSRV